MKFYLMRHGEAEMFAASDKQRALTSQGRIRLQEQITAIRSSLSDVDCILHSPYQRACETAAIVAQALKIDALAVVDGWTPSDDPVTAISTLEGYLQRTPLIVTHMPLVSNVEALLCDGSSSYPRAFNCGEISAIEAEFPAVGLGEKVLLG